MKIKIRLSDIITILFFHISFVVNIPYFSRYDLMKYAIIVIVGLYLIPKYKLLFRKEYLKVNIALVVFLAVALITSFINRNTIKTRNVFLTSIVFCAIVFEAFMLFQYFEYTKNLNRCINIIYWLTLIYIVLTDVLIIVKPSMNVDYENYYLIGNKFTVAFFHMQFLALYWYKRRKSKTDGLLQNKIAIAFILLLSIIISIMVDTATGVVGVFIMMFFLLFSYSSRKFFQKPIVAIIALIISCSVLLVYDAVLDSSFVKFIIVDVLNRDMTMTGRMLIYENIEKLFRGHMLTGYGCQSSFEVCMNLVHAPNTQNGLLEILLQYGLLGVVSFLILLYTSFKNIKLSKDVFPLVSMIYIYILLASTEITIGIPFFTLMGLIVSCDYKIIDESSEDTDIRIKG